MPQQEMQKQRRTTLKERTQEPRRYKVIVLNDDFTTFEFVIMIMTTVFLKTLQQAEEIAESTHIHQKATVGTYSYDIARSKVAKATAMARAENYPLSFEIEPE
jgi:ATP-dependent Clp protease adaptor protein ClpS